MSYISIPIVAVLIAVAWLLTQFRGWSWRQMLYGFVVGLLLAGTGFAMAIASGVNTGVASVGAAVGRAFADLSDGSR